MSRRLRWNQKPNWVDVHAGQTPKDFRGSSLPRSTKSIKEEEKRRKFFSWLEQASESLKQKRLLASPHMRFVDNKYNSCYIRVAKRYSTEDHDWQDDPHHFVIVDKSNPERLWNLDNETMYAAYKDGLAQHSRYDGLCTYDWKPTGELTIRIGDRVVFTGKLERECIRWFMFSPEALN